MDMRRPSLPTCIDSDERREAQLDLPRFRVTPDARLDHFPLAGDRASPTEC